MSWKNLYMLHWILSYDMLYWVRSGWQVALCASSRGCFYVVCSVVGVLLWVRFALSFDPLRCLCMVGCLMVLLNSLLLWGGLLLVLLWMFLASSAYILCFALSPCLWVALLLCCFGSKLLWIWVARSISSWIALVAFIWRVAKMRIALGVVIWRSALSTFIW